MLDIELPQPSPDQICANCAHWDMQFGILSGGYRREIDEFLNRRPNLRENADLREKMGMTGFCTAALEQPKFTFGAALCSQYHIITGELLFEEVPKG